MFYILFPFVSPQGTCPQVLETNIPVNTGTIQVSFPILYHCCDDFIFLAFVSIDLGLAFPKLAKFFFGGHFFLPAALKLPIITGLSDYPKL